MKSKKGISVMIGYVLLIALVISVSFVVYQMIRSYVPNPTQECPEGVSLIMDKVNCVGGKINIDVINNGLFDINGYNLRGETIDGRVVDLVNNYYSFSEPLSPKTDEVISAYFGGLSAETISSIEILPLRIQNEQIVICGNSKSKRDLVPPCEIDGSGTMGVECSLEGQCSNEYICNSSGQWVLHCGDSNLNCDEECDDGNTISGDGCSSSCISESCGNLGGDVCEGEEICPGDVLPANDAEVCCSEECTLPVWDYCSQCGDGPFNLCDKDECHSITEGCYYEGGFFNKCTSCSEMTCDKYNDPDCDGDRCAIGCEFDSSECIGVGCPNNYCNSTETCSTCEEDCGCCYGECDLDANPDLICDINSQWITACGDGTCNCGETSLSCNSDCPSTCGDGFCTSGETCSSCSADCGKCDGVSCSLDSSCESGFCVDGVCCEEECGVCETCAAITGACVPVTAGTDPGNDCSEIECTNYLFGAIGNGCYKYSSSTSNNGLCDGEGACYSAIDSCEGQGDLSAECGDERCVKSDQCVEGELATTCDTTTEFCYTSTIYQGECPEHYRCTTGGYCVDGSDGTTTCIEAVISYGNCDNVCLIQGYHSCKSAWTSYNCDEEGGGINSCSNSILEKGYNSCKCYNWKY